MKKGVITTLIFLIIVSLIIIGWFFYKPIISYVSELTGIKELDSSLAQLDDALKDIKIFTPEPLRGRMEFIESSNLTVFGVVTATNNFRSQAGLGTLANNAQLNNAAQAKLNDLFAKQYFEHVSPDGYGPDHWIDGVGYSYIAVGENLALGNYKDDQELVQAWMDSPGHRANILNEGFTEIGVAVGQKQFEDSVVWISVQIFATPPTACPSINENLKTQIAADQKQLDNLSNQLAATQDQLKKEKPKGQYSEEEAKKYNQLVTSYNNLADQHNNLANKIKQDVANYNQEVKAFNDCLAEL